MSPATAPEDPALRARRRYFPAVEGMRAVAAVCVLTGHVLYFGHPDGGWLQTVGSCMASYGVVVFFAISGFLLYRPFVAARGTGRSVASVAPSFYWRRAVRIFPAYWVALTGLTILFGLPGVFSAHWWVYYGLLEVYSTAWVANGLPTAWTLCVELSFYLALPLIAALLYSRGVGSGRRSAVRWELGVLGVLAALSLAWYGDFSVSADHAYLTANLFGAFTWFCSGMLIAAAQIAHPDAFAGARRILARSELCWPAALALFAVMPLGWIEELGLSPSLAAILGMLDLGLSAALLVGPAMLGDSGRLTRWALENRVLVFGGTISYGIYLWHYPIVTWLFGTRLVAESPFPVPAAYVLALSASVALGTASWYLVEKPLMRRARSVKAFARVRGEAAEAPSPPEAGPVPAAPAAVERAGA